MRPKRERPKLFLYVMLKNELKSKGSFCFFWKKSNRTNVRVMAGLNVEAAAAAAAAAPGLLAAALAGLQAAGAVQNRPAARYPWRTAAGQS